MAGIPPRPPVSRLPQGPQDWPTLARRLADISAAYEQQIHRDIPALRTALEDQIDGIRIDMMRGFANLEDKIMHRRAITRAPSDPPRNYSIPVTDTGSVLLDEVQDALDRLQRDKDIAEAKAAAVANHIAAERADADRRLNRRTKYMALATGIITILGFVAHYLSTH